MLTVRPDATGVTTCTAADDDVAGDPACGFRLAGGDLHVCTSRDGAVVDAASDKACFSWARHQLRTARLCPCAGAGGGERCPTCDDSGVVLATAAPAIAFESPDEQRDHLADTTTAYDDEPAPRGPDNTIYGFTCGDPDFHTHPGQPMHFHHAGPAGHHHVGDTVVYAERAPYVPTEGEAAAARALGLAS